MSSTREHFALFALPFVLFGCAADTAPTGATRPASATGVAPPMAAGVGTLQPTAAGGVQPPAAAGAMPPPTAAAGSGIPVVQRYASSVYAPLPISPRVAWPKGVRGALPSDQLGSIVGEEIYDASSGSPIVNAGISTRAKCTGSGCSTSADAINTAELKNGKFAFDAYAAKPQKLALEGDSAFKIGGKGYNTVTFAHGPYGTTTTGGQAITKFPKIYLCLVAEPDNDDDGICDAAEKRYGTDPKSKDTDKDGYSDSEELYGKVVSDGYALDLRGMGVNPIRFDLLVEVDYMPERAPQQGAIDAVIAAFSRAPVINEADPEKKTGINLHVFLDQEIEETTTINFYTLDEALLIRQFYLTLQVDLPIRYAVFGTTMHEINEKGEPQFIGYSGRADRVPGSMFAVTVGDWVNEPVKVAGTFMHELGHTLGLWHGGHEDVNWKPHYFSVMNYMYQLTGMPYEGVTDPMQMLDYSRGRYEALNETQLNEVAGIVQIDEPIEPDHLHVTNETESFTRPLYCAMQVPGDCVLDRYEESVPGPINFDHMPDWLPTQADLNGDGKIKDTFNTTPSDWASLQFVEPKLPGNNRVVQQLTPCALTRGPIFRDSMPATGTEPGVMPADPAPPTGTSVPSSVMGMGRMGGPVHLPPETGGFDYQLAARYTADARVGIISSNAGIAADGSYTADQPLDTTRYNICYLNALQTQPSDYNYWMSAHPDLILLDAAGQPVHDPDPEWQGEMLFDISTADKRMRLIALQQVWLSRCREAGFQAVEPDNLDSYTRAQGAISVNDAQSFMQLFVAEAHAFGLAVAQKNAASWVSEQGTDGMPRAASVGFDFAIIEECQLTGECDSLAAFYGAGRVFEIEYVYDTVDSSSGVSVAANTNDHFVQACAARGGSVRIVLRNRDVRASSEPGYVFELCGDMSGSGELGETQDTATPGTQSTAPENTEPGDPEPNPQQNPTPGDDQAPPPPQDPIPGDDQDPPPPQDPIPSDEPQDPYPPSDPQDPYPPSDPQDPNPGDEPQDPYPPSDPQDQYPPSDPQQDPPDQDPNPPTDPQQDAPQDPEQEEQEP